MAGPANGVRVGHEKSPRMSLQGSRDSALPRSRQDVAGGEVNGTSPERPGGPIRVKTAGESGRRGIHPFHFFKIIWASSSRLSRAVNILWPFVPAALAVYYTHTGPATLRFSLAYIAMVPCANLIGFSGQQLARKMPHMLGVLTETTCVAISPVPVLSYATRM
jgi:Ca2+:H+ antiporter